MLWGCCSLRVYLEPGEGQLPGPKIQSYVLLSPELWRMARSRSVHLAAITSVQFAMGAFSRQTGVRVCPRLRLPTNRHYIGRLAMTTIMTRGGARRGPVRSMSSRNPSCSSACDDHQHRGLSNRPVVGTRLLRTVDVERNPNSRSRQAASFTMGVISSVRSDVNELGHGRCKWRRQPKKNSKVPELALGIPKVCIAHGIRAFFAAYRKYKSLLHAHMSLFRLLPDRLF